MDTKFCLWRTHPKIILPPENRKRKGLKIYRPEPHNDYLSKVIYSNKRIFSFHIEIVYSKGYRKLNKHAALDLLLHHWDSKKRICCTTSQNFMDSRPEHFRFRVGDQGEPHSQNQDRVPQFRGGRPSLRCVMPESWWLRRSDGFQWIKTRVHFFF